MDHIRSCIACRKKSNKENLIKIVSRNKQAIYDIKQNMDTRSIYLCKDKKCFEKCIKSLENSKLKIKIELDKEKLIELIKNIDIELEE
ncbi:MAG: YlxR family protein [Clostridia bacterium]